MLPPVRPLDTDGAYPLSATQLRLWRLEQLTATGRLAYNVTYPLTLRGELRYPALRSALSDLVERHTALRTALVERPDGPVQQVQRAGGSPMVVTDLSGVGSGDVDRWLDRVACRRFDLAAGAPFRVDVGRLAPDEHVLLVSGHHIVMDGRSLAVVLRELGELYAGHVLGRPPALAPARFQARDFVSWQRRWLGAPAGEAHRSYWLAQLARTEFAHLDRAGDRPADLDYTGDRAEQEIPAPVLARIGALARRENVSMATVCLAVYQSLLHRYSGQPGLVVGVPAPNRGRPELSDVVGFLVNILPIPSESSGAGTLRESVRATEQRLASAYIHQSMPIEHLTASALPAAPPDRLPVDTFFAAYRRVVSHPLRMPGLTLGATPTLRTKDTEFPLMMTVTSDRAGALATLSYGAWAVGAAEAGELVATYVRQLDLATGAPDAAMPGLDRTAGRP